MNFDQTDTAMRTSPVSARCLRLKDVLARHAYRFAGLSLQADLLIQRLSATVGFNNDAPVQHLPGYRNYAKCVSALG